MRLLLLFSFICISNFRLIKPLRCEGSTESHTHTQLIRWRPMLEATDHSSCKNGAKGWEEAVAAHGCLIVWRDRATRLGRIQSNLQIILYLWCPVLKGEVEKFWRGEGQGESLQSRKWLIINYKNHSVGPMNSGNIKYICPLPFYQAKSHIISSTARASRTPLVQAQNTLSQHFLQYPRTASHTVILMLPGSWAPLGPDDSIWMTSMGSYLCSYVIEQCSPTWSRVVPSRAAECQNRGFLLAG